MHHAFKTWCIVSTNSRYANKATVFVLKTVAFLTFLVNPLGGLGQFKSFQKRKHMLRKMAAGVYLFCEDLYGGAGS